MKKIVLVGEVGINHNGDMDIVKKLINVANLANLDYVKFQKRTVEKVYTKEELDKYRESPWGFSNREQKMGLELNQKQYDQIDAYCRANSIGWFASPWDTESVLFLKQYEPPYIKIPSALITNSELLNTIKYHTNTPVIISTGMSTKAEVDKCLEVLGNRVEYILACTSTYPTKDSEMNMKFISTLKNEYSPKYKIGFSNHSPGIFWASVAPAFGAEMIEFHITLDRSMYGSDQAASIEPAGVTKLASYCKSWQEGMGTGEWIVYPSEEEIKKKLRR